MKALIWTCSKTDCPPLEALPMARSFLANRSLVCIWDPPCEYSTPVPQQCCPTLHGPLTFPLARPPPRGVWSIFSLLSTHKYITSSSLISLTREQASYHHGPWCLPGTTPRASWKPLPCPGSAATKQSSDSAGLFFICQFTWKRTTCSHQARKRLPVFQEFFIKGSTRLGIHWIPQHNTQNPRKAS